jgi:hypothetical protein
MFVKSYRWRLLLLCTLLLFATGFNVLLRVTAPPIDSPVTSFVALWLVSFLPYLAACALVLVSKPPAGRQRWIELSIILLGALVLRLIVLPVPPNLSHDAWRYLWDARITLHGYSPYVYVPRDPALVHLRNISFDNSRYRDVPTLYPPGAQAFYLLSYLLAPDNLLVLKSMFVGLDLVTCCALAFLLLSRGLDPARCIIYAWCPLPIIEFAFQGHHEAITIAFTALAFMCASGTWRGSRIVTGFLIAMATLTNIYPILFLPVLLRRGDNLLLAMTTLHTRQVSSRSWLAKVGLTYQILLGFLGMCWRDWALLATCFATVILAYVPYALLGHGQVFGFLTTYTSEPSSNAGSVLLTVRWLGAAIGLSQAATLVLGYGVDLLVVGGMALVVGWLRKLERISVEVAVLLLTGAVFAVSTHLYPWYTIALLPWLALAIGPLWTRKGGVSGKHLAVLVTWYFACISITWYFFFFLFFTSPTWGVYYLLAYDVTLVGLGIAAVLGLRRLRRMKRGLSRESEYQAR